MKPTFGIKKAFTQKIALFLGASLLVALGFFAGRSSKSTTQLSPSPIQETTEPEGKPSPSSSEESEEKLSKGQISKRGIISYVIDGDTIELETGQKVRYVGISTPDYKQPFY